MESFFAVNPISLAFLNYFTLSKLRNSCRSRVGMRKLEAIFLSYTFIILESDYNGKISVF